MGTDLGAGAMDGTTEDTEDTEGDRAFFGEGEVPPEPQRSCVSGVVFF